MKVYAITDVGKVRKLNEDSYYLPVNGECFCAVADGMGGHNAGEVASALAVEVFAETMRKLPQAGEAQLRKAVLAANAAVYAASLKDAGRRGMGTTLTTMGVNGAEACFAHVGDSRVYLCRRESFVQVTKDHTLVQALMERGLITAAEAKKHPQRNVITRAVGTGIGVEVDAFALPVEAGDVYLLCSDGLSNHVEISKMHAITGGEGSWEEKLVHLVQAALDDGGSDNITAMYVVLEEVHA